MGRDPGRLPAQAAALALSLVLLAACSADPATPPGGDPSTAAPSPTTAVPSDRPFPDIIAATLLPQPDDTFDVAVTMSSPYDSPERYADGWRVLTPEGAVLGTHSLLHDHAGEQPFTRTQTGLRIPMGIDSVIVEGRDLVNGYGGATIVVAVPGR